MAPVHPSEELLAAALAEERDTLAAVMENTPEASLVYLDRDFNFVLVNSTYAAACGVTREALIGRYHFDVFPDEENEEIFRRARETKKPAVFRAKPFVFEHQPWLGVTYWDWTLTPLTGADGEVRGFVFSLVDVTERVRRQQLSDALAALDEIVHSTPRFGEVLERVTDGAAEAAGCESAGIALRYGDRWRADYVNPLVRDVAGGRWFTAEEIPVAELAASTRAIVILNDVSAEDPHIQASLEPFGVKSFLNVPLFVGGEVAGVFAMGYHSEAVAFSKPVIDFATRLGTSISLALSNARLYEQQREANLYTDALNRVLTAFVSTLDPDEVLERVVEESVRAVGADYSVISVVEDGEWVVKHRFGIGGGARIGVRDPYAERPVIVDAAESQEIQLIEDALESPRTNKDIMCTFDIGGFAAVPLLTKGVTIGVLELTYSTPTVFDEGCVSFLEQLMVTASLALEQARAFEHEHRIADTLQEALLVLPERVPGIEFSHSYLAASETSRVGGDFYDLFELDHGLVGVTIGDISGKGLDAAVVTSLVKNTIRAAATEKGRSPADAMRLANTVLYRGSGPTTFATVFFGIFDPRDGRLVYCDAGHETPVVVRAEGRAEMLPQNSPLVGAMPDAGFQDSEAWLCEGDQLFLYTDGLIEARAGRVFFGEERLLEILGGMAGGALRQTVDAAVDAAVQFAGGCLSDDVAVLAMRWNPATANVVEQQKLPFG